MGRVTPPAQEIDVLNRLQNQILRTRANGEFQEKEQPGVARILKMISQITAQISRSVKNDSEKYD